MQHRRVRLSCASCSVAHSVVYTQLAARVSSSPLAGVGVLLGTLCTAAVKQLHACGVTGVAQNQPLPQQGHQLVRCGQLDHGSLTLAPLPVVP